MELAISTYSLLRWRRENRKTLEQSLDWIAGTGVKAVEFAGPDDQPPADPIRRARVLRKRCEKLGLAVVGYCVGAELFVPRVERREVVDQLKRHVDVAAELGVPSMRHDVTKGPPPLAPRSRRRRPSREAVIAAVVPAIREVAEYGHTVGIKTSVENHGFYLQGMSHVAHFLQAVDHPNFGLTLDMGNFMVVDEDPVRAVRHLAKHAIMVHVKDFHQRRKDRMPPSGWFVTPTPFALRGAIPGHGVIDIPAQLRILKQRGYDGYLSLEFEGIEEPTMAVSLGLEYLRRELASLECDEMRRNATFL